MKQRRTRWRPFDSWIKARWDFTFGWRLQSCEILHSKKEPNEEEEDISSFLGSLEEVEGDRWSDLIPIKKDLDSDFLLKINLILIFFLPRNQFIWRIDLLWCKFLLNLKWNIRRKIKRWRSFEKNSFPF